MSNILGKRWHQLGSNNNKGNSAQPSTLSPAMWPVSSWYFFWWQGKSEPYTLICNSLIFQKTVDYSFLCPMLPLSFPHFLPSSLPSARAWIVHIPGHSAANSASRAIKIYASLTTSHLFYQRAIQSKSLWVFLYYFGSWLTDLSVLLFISWLVFQR